MALPSCDVASVADGLVINEILVDPEGVDPGLQWVEVYNETGLDLDASGWRIEAGTATYDTASTFPAGTWLIDGEYVVFSQRVLSFATVVVPGFVAGPATADADAIRLVDCQGAPVDTVVYGAINLEGWLDEAGGVVTALAPVPASGQTLARGTGGFALSASPTPGSDNALPPVHCGGPGSGLLVNEVFAGTGAWVELLHTGTAPVLLEGWSIAVGTTSLNPAFTFPAGQAASPGARLVVAAGPLAGAGAVRLVDCKGFAADTLVIGPVNAMGWVDDRGVAATGLAPVPGPGLSRYPDGGDTDDSALDFAVLGPTPAAGNRPLPEDTGAPPVDTGPAPDTASGPVDREPAPGGCGCRTPVPSHAWLAGFALAWLRHYRHRRSA